MNNLAHVPAYQICTTMNQRPGAPFIIFHFELLGGILICAHHSALKRGGAVLVTDSSLKSLQYLDQLIDVLGAPLKTDSTDEAFAFKVIGPIQGLKAVDRKIRALCPAGSITLCPTEVRDLHAYYYGDSGRARIGGTQEVLEPASRSAVASDSKSLGKKRVLIVDDSRSIRQILSKILEKDFHVVGCAERPSQVEEMIVSLNPDVITLDIHMPEMDGVTLLKKYLPKYPIPTIMISSISMEESSHVLQALEAGAVDYIKKPSLDELATVAPIIIEKIKTTANVKVRTSLDAHADHAPNPILPSGNLTQSIIVAMGASTGGTEALRKVLTQLPKDIPPIVIVQHIPPVFSKAFANRLNELCQFKVKEAEDGDELIPGLALIAPGGLQMSIAKHSSSLTGYKIRIEDSPPINRHKPSVDVLFDSVAKFAGKKAVGVILTGMGNDGAKGLLKMRQSGARTIAQDEATSVVFGMPQAAITLKAAECVKPLGRISHELLSILTLPNARPLRQV